MTPKAVTDEVKDANLRGRGGAGFPTGLKWSFVPLGKDAPNPTYLVVNADEMEPGTFKDRLLMERDPHQLIEGMIIAGIRHRGRHRVHLSARRVHAGRRTACARHRGSIRTRIISARTFSVPATAWKCYLHLSAGRYICGDETGLLNALEGKRANPRSKPPFPPVVGLFGKPTIVNNVETLCCVPHIINNGAAWFRGLSRTKDGGTKLYGVSGKVKRPGLWELPMGTTDPRNSRRACRRHARRAEVSRTAAGRRINRLSSSKSTWTRPWISPKWRKSAAAWAPAP